MKTIQNSSTNRSVGNAFRYCILCIVILLITCDKKSGSNDSKANLTVNKRENPVLTNKNGLVADPSVIRYNGELIMVYSDYSLATDSITFNAATSQDGISWTHISTEEGFRIFSGDVSSWDKLIETPELVVINDSLYMYYIGYPESNFDNGIYESEIGLAVGDELTNLKRTQSTPILPRGGAKDKDALTSPTVIFHQNQYFMMYTGWADILTASGFLGQTGATSPDGRNWIKNEEALFEKVIDTKFETATETDLVKAPDGMFYLFFSAEGGIALARSNQPFDL